jgi:hypothetical protein
MLTEIVSTASARGVGNADQSLHVARRTYADILALDRALVLADLPAARAAFLRLQEDLPLIAAAVSSNPFPLNAGSQRALQRLARCLSMGDLSGARQAFNSFAPPGEPSAQHEGRITPAATLA